jgi:uncharacterized protein (TIGR02246 family)
MTDNDPSGSSESDRRADEEAIRNLLDRQIKAWDAADPDAYAAVYTLDGDCVSFLGSHYNGREAIADSYEVPRASSLFRKVMRGARLDFQVTNLRFLTSDVALVQAAGGVTKGSGPSRRSLRTNTSIAVRTGDGWLLAASHNTTHRPLAARLLNKLVSPQH